MSNINPDYRLPVAITELPDEVQMFPLRRVAGYQTYVGLDRRCYIRVEEVAARLTRTNPNAASALLGVVLEFDTGSEEGVEE